MNLNSQDFDGMSLPNSMYQTVLDGIYREVKQEDNLGKVADYIPGLSQVNPEKLGFCLCTTELERYFVGDVRERFSIQSIAKVFSLTLAFELTGEKLWQRVDVEPSGNPFNSLVLLEYEAGKPRNPFINAGAIVVCDVLVSCLQNPKQELLEFIRRVAANPSLDYNPKIAAEESATGFRNHALINLMKDCGNIHNDIGTVLDLYFHLCSIEMTCEELSEAFLYLACRGKNPLNGEVILNPSKTKRINAIMQLCGFYDEAGEYAFKVGLPGKSGVGGGIVAVHPGQYSIAVWSPKLNKKGNSYRGMKVLEQLTTKMESSIF